MLLHDSYILAIIILEAKITRNWSQIHLTCLCWELPQGLVADGTYQTVPNWKLRRWLSSSLLLDAPRSLPVVAYWLSCQLPSEIAGWQHPSSYCERPSKYKKFQRLIFITQSQTYPSAYRAYLSTCIYVNQEYMRIHCIPYFLEISPHLEIPPPSKCCRIFQPTHPNKRCPWNLAAWYGVDNDISMHMRILYVHTNRLITEAVYARACRYL